MIKAGRNLEQRRLMAVGKVKGKIFKFFCEGWQILNTAIEEFLLCNNCTSIILV